MLSWLYYHRMQGWNIFLLFCDIAIGLTKITTFENILHFQCGSFMHVYMWFSKQSNTWLEPCIFV